MNLQGTVPDDLGKSGMHIVGDEEDEQSNLESTGMKKVSDDENLTEKDIDDMMKKHWDPEDVEQLKEDIKKGIGAEETSDKQEIRVITRLGLAPLSKIVANHMQPRFLMFETQKEFDEMVESIKVRGNVLRPIIITYHKDGFKLIDGERRVITSRAAGIDKILSIIKFYVNSNGEIIEMDDVQLLEEAMLANSHQRKMTPMEEALGYAQWIEKTGKTKTECAARFGKQASDISNFLKLLRLEESLQADVMHGKMSKVLGWQLASFPVGRQQEMRGEYDRILESFGGKVPDSNVSSWTAKILRKIAEDKGIAIVIRSRRQVQPKTHAQLVLSPINNKVQRIEQSLRELEALKTKDLIVNKITVNKIMKTLNDLAKNCELTRGIIQGKIAQFSSYLNQD